MAALASHLVGVHPIAEATDVHDDADTVKGLLSHGLPQAFASDHLLTLVEAADLLLTESLCEAGGDDE